MSLQDGVNRAEETTASWSLLMILCAVAFDDDDDGLYDLRVDGVDVQRR